MLVIVQKGRECELESVFEKWDLHAAQIGEVKMAIAWWSDIRCDCCRFACEVAY